MNKKEKAKFLFANLELMYPNACCELNYNSLFQLLVAVVLSSQCKDSSVNKVTEVLFAKYPTPHLLKEAKLEDVEMILKPLGLYKNKARNIIDLALELVSLYDGEVPNSLEKLMSLSGVGYKTASVVLVEGFKIPAFPTDTHIKRTLNRFGLVKDDDPTSISKKMMKLFEPSCYHELHHRLIFLGRYTCKAKSPNCQNCLLNKECQYFKRK